MLSSTTVAEVCTVPGSHATIQAAIDDLVCTRIDLAAQTYPESVNISRSLDLAGLAAGGSALAGSVQVTGAGTLVNLSNLALQNVGAASALLVQGGARVQATGLVAQRTATTPIIFNDSFESS